jgi:hypothetical protein
MLFFGVICSAGWVGAGGPWWVGALAGVLFGLATGFGLSGAKGRVVDFFFGPEEEEDKEE